MRLGCHKSDAYPVLCREATRHTVEYERRTMGITSTLHRPLLRAWHVLADPPHHAAVHRLRVACEIGDRAGLASLLDPGVAVVVDSGDDEHPMIGVVGGVTDVVSLLIQGMSADGGCAAREGTVNGQAGIMLDRGDEAVATINVDFTGRLVSCVWIRLHPVRLRHWNRV
jgi:hypothetical protein